jgi:FK506-binding nuclear protein
VEHEPVAADKTSKKAKKLKAENGAAVPVSADADAGDKKKAEKKDKKDKKAKKGVESKEDSKKEEGKGGDVKLKLELPSGLKIQDATLGDGPQAKSGTKVVMRYIGKLPDGKVFDSNTKGKPVRHPR